MLWVYSTLTFKAGSPGGHYSLFFFFFLLLRALPTTLREAPKKASCPYANTKIHMPIICTWHGSVQVLLTPQFSCIDFK